MSEKHFEDFWNRIPSGRQLPRTSTLTDVKRQLDLSTEDSNTDCGELQQNMEAGSRDQDDQNKTFDFNAHEAKPVCSENIFKPDDPKSSLKGMKGYLLTTEDLEFIEKMEEEKLIKKLQGDLEEMQRLLKMEMMALELTLASKENAQAKLYQFPSCEELIDWVKVVLKRTSPLTDLSDLDAKSLLTMVTKENVHKVVEEKRIELTQMEKMVANKKKKEAEERGQIEEQIASEQLELQGLMSCLSDLKSELAQVEEAYKDLQMQINIQDAKENKTDASEKLSAAKSHTKKGRERRKAVTSAEKLQDASKTGNQTSLKDDPAHKSTNESTQTSTKEQTKQKAGTEKSAKSVKAARGSQRKAEQQESNSQESVQAVRGRRPPAGPSKTTDPQLKNKVK